VRLRVGTRGSALALVQARWTLAALGERGHDADLEVIETSGDADRTSPFAAIGPPGVFVREIERALCEGRIDLAVHSYKDLPASSPDGLVVAAVPPRADPADRLLIRPDAHDEGAGLLPVVEGARVGSSAARRATLLRDVRDDLVIAPLRGNVPTRVRRLLEGDHDAVVLAAAGLDRLDDAAGRGECAPVERGGIVELRLDPARFVPAPSQGALALQVRAGSPAQAAVAELDDPGARRAVEAERQLLGLVQAGCDAPFGAHGTEPEPGRLVLRAVLPVTGRLRRVRVEGASPKEVAARAFEALGAAEESRA
jgi:hydroxymethylbilane synthase